MNGPPQPVDRPLLDLPWGQKFAAMGVHFGLSLAAIGILLAVNLTLWYPDFFFATDGGWEGLRIVVLVDLVLGPLLTFVAFRRGKPGLLLDMSLIALLQFSALFAGAWILHSERPLLLSFDEVRFYSISADDYERIGQPVPDLSFLPGPSPKRVFIRLPGDVIEQADTRRMLLQRDQRVYTYAPAMLPLAERIDEVVARGVSRREIDARDADDVLEAFLAEHGGAFEDYAFVPYSSRFKYVYIGIRRSDGEIVDILDIPAPQPM